MLNNAAFNPTQGCSNSEHCTGNGGLLAFMEIPSPACVTPGPTAGTIQPVTGTPGISDGAIAGIVIGAVAGAVLLCCFAWLVQRKE